VYFVNHAALRAALPARGERLCRDAAEGGLGVYEVCLRLPKFIPHRQMCWSADASILSFIVGCLGIILAAYKNFSPYILFFFATIVLMQLVEYVVWSYGVDTSKEGCGDACVSTINFGASLSAAALLALQPIASILTLTQSYIPVMAYLILGIIAQVIDHSLDVRSLKERYKMTAEPHLVWHWLRPTPRASLLVYFIFLLTPLVLSGQFALLAVVLAALAFSVVSYARAWGSIWCYAIHLIVVALCVMK